MHAEGLSRARGREHPLDERPVDPRVVRDDEAGTLDERARRLDVNSLPANVVARESRQVRDFGRERAAGVVAECMRIVIVRAILFTSATAATLNGRHSAMGAGNGAFAWEYLRRNAEYRAVHEASAHAPSFEPAPFSVRIQGRADPVAARFALPAWKDPDREDGVLSPFWAEAPMPDAELVQGARPTLALLASAGARIEGLRLAAGGLVLKSAKRQIGVR